MYCGTARAGLFRSRDSGRNWEPVGRGIDHLMVTAVDVGHAEQADGFGVVYAGTEPSAVFRSPGQLSYQFRPKALRIADEFECNGLDFDSGAKPLWHCDDPGIEFGRPCRIPVSLRLG